ncbi:MAG: hypothetical protein Kow0029_13510 [Candidatus Rifleibacteriota bacterium]
MTQEYNLAFQDGNLELSWFRLSKSSLKQLSDRPNDSDDSAENILVLPSVSGLPFQIELPFSDPEKIRKVIPQFVADQYSEVNTDWLFSWRLSEKPAANFAEASAKPERSEEIASDVHDKTGSGPEAGEVVAACLVSGVAFPPEFNKTIQSEEFQWRLVLPDVFLLEAGYGCAYRLKTPCSEFVAIYGTAGLITRIVADNAIPLRPLLASHGLEKVVDFEFAANPAQLYARLTYWLGCSANVDLSGWHQKRKSTLLRWSVGSCIALFLGAVFISHFFLWFEIVLNENAAKRTLDSMKAAFNQVFPGVPVVDPVSQVKRKKALAEEQLIEATSIPNIPWVELLKFVSLAPSSGARIFKMLGRNNGFRIHGFAVNYTSVENYRKTIEASKALERISTVESRKSGDEVLFVLEGTWKN